MMELKIYELVLQLTGENRGRRKEKFLYACLYLHEQRVE